MVLLDALHIRHVVWIDNMNDDELKNIHSEIIDLLLQATDKYQILLASYQKHVE